MMFPAVLTCTVATAGLERLWRIASLRGQMGREAGWGPDVEERKVLDSPHIRHDRCGVTVVYRWFPFEISSDQPLRSMNGSIPASRTPQRTNQLPALEFSSTDPQNL